MTDVAVRVLVELRRGEGGRLSARVQGVDPARECGEVDLPELALLLEALLEDAGRENGRTGPAPGR